MIQLEKIDKYFGEHRVLSSVDLQLAPGNVTAIDTAPQPVWAFVSITNNVTQQVTTITPTVAVTNVGAKTE